MGILRERNVKNLLKDICSFSVLHKYYNFIHSSFCISKKNQEQCGSDCDVFQNKKELQKKTNSFYCSSATTLYRKTIKFSFYRVSTFLSREMHILSSNSSSSKKDAVVILNKNISRPLPKLHISKFLFVFEVFFWLMLVCLPKVSLCLICLIKSCGLSSINFQFILSASLKLEPIYLVARQTPFIKLKSTQ